MKYDEITMENIFEWGENNHPMCTSRIGHKFLIMYVNLMLYRNKMEFDEDHVSDLITAFVEDVFTVITKNYPLETFLYKLYVFILRDTEDCLWSAKNELLMTPGCVQTEMNESIEAVLNQEKNLRMSRFSLDGFEDLA